MLWKDTVLRKEVMESNVSTNLKHIDIVQLHCDMSLFEIRLSCGF